MTYYLGADTEPMRVEEYASDPAECHSCGKIGRPRKLIHFAHLCQHFVALCPKCWKAFVKLVTSGGKQADEKAK